MCGIVGFTDFHRKNSCDTSDAILHAMMETLMRRGPDEFGTYDNDAIYLGHRRLIVVDPAGRCSTNCIYTCWYRICYCV